MVEISRSAIVPYAADKIFDLINDVAAYPQYMNGCVASRVIASDSNSMLAELTVAKAGIKHSFVTKNTLQRPERIALLLERGPFDTFEGEWLLKVLSDEACKVSFDLRFSVNNVIARQALGALVSGVGTEMVDAICARAKKLYG